MDRRIKEGDLYKTLTIHGKTFHLYYGYYDEIERTGPYSELIPIYPNFQKAPLYTEDGKPFVTQMQDACEYYDGHSTADECHDCRHFRPGEELIGICSCRQNRIFPLEQSRNQSIRNPLQKRMEETT